MTNSTEDRAVGAEWRQRVAWSEEIVAIAQALLADPSLVS